VKFIVVCLRIIFALPNLHSGSVPDRVGLDWVSDSSCDIIDCWYECVCETVSDVAGYLVLRYLHYFNVKRALGTKWHLGHEDLVCSTLTGFAVHKTQSTS